MWTEMHLLITSKKIYVLSQSVASHQDIIWENFTLFCWRALREYFWLDFIGIYKKVCEGLINWETRSLVDMFSFLAFLLGNKHCKLIRLLCQEIMNCSVLFSCFFTLRHYYHAGFLEMYFLSANLEIFVSTESTIH